MSSNSNSTNEEDSESKQKEINGMKKNVKQFTGAFIDKKSNETVQNKIIKTDIFSVAINSEDPNDKESRDKEAIKEGISTADFSECEKILKGHYNISSNLLVKKVEFDPKMDVNRSKNPYASKGLTFEFLNPITFEKLNITYCSEKKTPLKIPFKKGEKLNISLYSQSARINKGLDLYNDKSPGFHSRCIKSNQLDTGADLSINYKRNKMFQNNSIGCSPGCEYDGLDENKYVKCNCEVKDDMETSNNGVDISFSPLPSMNYDIVNCYYETYRDVKYF